MNTSETIKRVENGKKTESGGLEEGLSTTGGPQRKKEKGGGK